MARRSRTESPKSTAVILPGSSILGTAVYVIRTLGNFPMSPQDIAETALYFRLMRVPRGRNRSYITQLIQSRLYDNSHFENQRMVIRTAKGRYKVRSTSL